MTKTLIEKWCEGTLEEGLYYIEGKGNYDIALIRNRYCPVLTSPYCEDDVFESEFVPVDPVPSYEEWHRVKDLGLRPDYTDHIEKWEDCARLTKKLAIATKALKKLTRDCNKWEIARKALKEIERPQ